MLESLGQFIRLTRQRRNLTQAALAELAGVSRWQLVQMEKGENVSVEFLLKVAGALQLEELPVEFVTLRNSPDALPLLIAAEAIDAARRALDRLDGIRESLDGASEAIVALLTRPTALGESKRRIVQAAKRLAATSPERSGSVGRILREHSESPGKHVHRSRAKDHSAAKSHAG